METIFYYFLTRAIEEEPMSEPYCTDVFLGNIGDFVSIDGVGYYISDFAVEHYNWNELIAGGAY